MQHPNLVGREVAPQLEYQELLPVLRSPRAVVFLIVRHPLDRLVSAYRDKLERLGPTFTRPASDPYYNLYGRQIVSQFRHAAIARFGPQFFSAENNFGSPGPVPRRTAALPSW